MRVVNLRRYLLVPLLCLGLSCFAWGGRGPKTCDRTYRCLGEGDLYFLRSETGNEIVFRTSGDSLEIASYDGKWKMPGILSDAEVTVALVGDARVERLGIASKSGRRIYLMILEKSSEDQNVREFRDSLVVTKTECRLKVAESPQLLVTCFTRGDKNIVEYQLYRECSPGLGCGVNIEWRMNEKSLPIGLLQKLLMQDESW